MFCHEKNGREWDYFEKSSLEELIQVGLDLLVRRGGYFVALFLRDTNICIVLGSFTTLSLDSALKIKQNRTWCGAVPRCAHACL